MVRVRVTTELTWEEIERRSGLKVLAEKEHTSKTNKLRRVGDPIAVMTGDDKQAPRAPLAAEATSTCSGTTS